MGMVVGIARTRRTQSRRPAQVPARQIFCTDKGSLSVRISAAWHPSLVDTWKYPWINISIRFVARAKGVSPLGVRAGVCDEKGATQIIDATTTRLPPATEISKRGQLA